jgi:thiol-disulfide isomerase/thioredoxin
MKELQSEDQLQDYIDGQAILLFSADWCPDCRVIEPVLPEIEQKYSEFTFVHINRDRFLEICQQYDVFGIPSFVAFKENKEIGRFVSRDRKTKDEIEEFIESLS